MHSGHAELAKLATTELLPPIHRLHAELLELIFNFYIGHLIEYYRDSRLFIPWTHVCHTWRAIALSSPRLWRCINFSQPDIAAEYLIRSKNAPICIMTPKASGWTKPFYYSIGESLRQHAERIREIDIILEHLDMHDFTMSFGSALPALSSLSIHLFATDDLNLNCAMPHLRQVHLRGVALPWDVCTNLTSLTVQMLSVTSPSISQLLAIMMRSPALENIKLAGIRPAIGTAAVCQTPIDLPHLHTLHFSIAPDLVLHILSCISIPSFATIHVFCRVSSLASVIPRHVQHLHNISSADETILRLDPFRLELRRSRPANHGSATILQVAIGDMSQETLWSLVEIIDTSKIATLEINGWQLGITSTLFRAFMTELTGITTLRVEYAGNDFFSILAQPEEASFRMGPILATDIVCLQLKSVIIDHFIDTDEVSLVAWLKERTQLGVRLRKLELHNCDVDQKKLNESRLWVDEMILRGVEDMFPTNNSRIRRWAGRKGFI